MPDRIIDVKARQVLDSRGNPTLEVDVHTKTSLGSAMVPSGASTGKYEAVELRDNNSSYHGKSVQKAVKHVNTTIKKHLVGISVTRQAHIDGELIHLDNTKNKSRLGANAILGVSMAVARAAAASKNKALFSYLATLAGTTPKLPVPFANVINGGKHAGGGLEFQEFMIAPTKAKSFSQAMQMVCEVYHELQLILKKKYGPTSTLVGDEGGFSPPLSKPPQALDLLVTAITNAGYKGKVFIAMDPAASEFYYPHHQVYTKSNMYSEQFIKYYHDLVKHYPIISIEDPFDQDDTSSWQAFTKLMKRRSSFQVVGDDLLVTNPERIAQAVKEQWCNALLLKVNQIGTITEALRAARIAQRAGWKVMVSHRSGETEDPFIADLAVALGCGQIKLGAPARGERTAKYNQLLRIEEYLGSKARYGL